MTVRVADFAACYPHVTLPAWLHDVDTVHKPADYARGETHAFVLAMHWAMETEAWIPRVINVETRARELCREWDAPMPPPTNWTQDPEEYRRRYRDV